VTTCGEYLENVWFANDSVGIAVGGGGAILRTTTGGVLTNVVEASDGIAAGFLLHQNYPNPFNPRTTIRFEIEREGHVNLKVYDLQGREVAELLNRRMPAGKIGVVFDATYLSTGVYFYRLVNEQFNQSKKMVYLK
jgi:hypothetical protein